MNMLSPHLFQSLHQWRTEVLVSVVTLQAAKAKCLSGRPTAFKTFSFINSIKS